MIDNYDSFTYNLVRYFEELGEGIEVALNDKISLGSISKKAPKAIIISPGPKTPLEAGLSLKVVEKFAGKIPILGVCLGHQAIGQAFGAKVVRAPEPFHGRESKVYHTKTGVFKGLPSPFRVIRYHSLTLKPETIPNCLQVTAKTKDGVVMGLAHKEMALHGVQFHPESLLSQHGHALLQNFLKSAQ